jgi:hypothetical protein
MLFRSYGYTPGALKRQQLISLIFIQSKWDSSGWNHKNEQEEEI